jgi:hypothetical protein
VEKDTKYPEKDLFPELAAAFLVKDGGKGYFRG